jgi:hypothetical protein
VIQATPEADQDHKRKVSHGKLSRPCLKIEGAKEVTWWQSPSLAHMRPSFHSPILKKEKKVLRQFSEKRVVFSTDDAGATEYSHAKE